MGKEVLSTPGAPPALGPYSVAVRAGGLVFLSGQVALKPEGGREDGDVTAQTRQIMNNIGALLSDLGLDYSDIAKTTIFMVDMGDYAAINEVYAGYFDEEPPARSAVEVSALPGGFLVEIEVVATLNQG
ncbi:MAG: deaminase [Acidimicrobiia bacterium]|nr:Rid family detoxifying hydrolase [bacterium]MXX64059.1 deaminase [Acidimicrobiia bacterium]MCY3579561.1 Rid family detoxifying hydrolase [bacterium]MCY3651859.1 Rid family detoxifying hydrolase [bacterium]MDE0642696.1 Rid family detoxifying hydrolase [bacterium]